jgi:glycosyltransferase involved in cell wall biosynthesis
MIRNRAIRKKTHRIVVHDYAGHPFQVQLSRELARRGFEVLHLYYGFNNTPKGDLEKRESDPICLNINGILTKHPVQKYSYIQRWRQDIEYGKLISGILEDYQPDVVISANTPLDAQKSILKVCKEMEAKFVFWLQDLIGIAAHDLLKYKLPVIGRLIGLYQIKLEKNILKQSNAIILIADEFKPVVTGWGINDQYIKVIPNWAPLENIPVKPKINPWSIKHGVAEKFCILYTGGLGLKHNPDLLLKLASHHMNNKNIHVLIVAEGPGATWLQEQKEIHHLQNLTILGYQPFNKMADVLASGDILTAILQPSAGSFSVPSKVLAYLCAERSILLAIPGENLAAKIITSNNAGSVVPPDDIDAFLAKTDLLYHNPDIRNKNAKNGRMYAEANFAIQDIGDRFEEIIIS